MNGQSDYHPASSAAASAGLTELVDNDRLDGDVFAVLRRNFAAINAIRR